jgi:hypothetical protein
MAERGKRIIAATIGFTCMKFQELFEMGQDSLRPAARGRRIVMGPMKRFCMTIVYSTLAMTPRKLAIFSRRQSD